MKWSSILHAIFPRGGRTHHEQGSNGKSRLFAINDRHNSMNAHAKFAGNNITTSKYSVLTYLPRSLFEQYRRPANWYFTLMAVLSLTELSPFSPFTTFFPLSFVIGLSMIKEGYEDFRRHRSDNEENGRHVDIWSTEDSRFHRRRWDEVEVGDIVRVRRDEPLPADLLLLNSSSDEGVCFVETANLDGETNLKAKKGPDGTQWVNDRAIPQLRGTIECELPNPHLYTFVGNLTLAIGGRDADNADGTMGPAEPGKQGGESPMPIQPSMMLLRGSTLRNTQCVIGVVVFTGHETKVMMNASKAKSKRSTIEVMLDQVVWMMFGLLFTLCLISSIMAVALVDDLKVHWYLEPAEIAELNGQFDPDQKGIVWFYTLLNTMVLYGYLVPISLYVSVEVVRIITALVFINLDVSMYDPVSNQPCQARTSNLNEELGMVEIVLSDKTGTLTQNQMEFFKCSIAGIAYGAGKTEVEWALESKRPGGAVASQTDDAAEAKRAAAREKGFNFWDDRLMGGAWEQQPTRGAVEMFLRCLAVCHTVIPEGPDQPEAIKYEAESPDEEALIVAAKKMGFFFHTRTTTTITVRETIRGRAQDVTYELLNVLEFNSTRKRMSVICRREDGRMMLFCKGADTVIYERMSDGNTKQCRENTRLHLQTFADAGLRTLVLAYREITTREYDKWLKGYNKARTAIENREEGLMASFDEIEKDLMLLGATAIEDKLQVGVPKTIEQLLNAGIKVWVLTGDKLETAVNIGHACNLLRHDMDIFVISADTGTVLALEERGQKEEAIKAARDATCSKLKDAWERVLSAAGGNGPTPDFGLVVAGRALGHCLEDDDVRDRFWEVASRCSSVVCCRVSPKEKGLVTALCRSRGLRTLAIGDGANDVQMIRAAQVGVGISGLEGRQAVMSSDFAIGQFRFLETLLLVHGRWCYKRVARMVNYFFHKNIVFGLSLFYFNAFTRFSGGMNYDEFYISIYNVVFTVLPPVIVGIFDQDVPREACYRYPGLYRQGINNSYFNWRARAGWVTSAVIQSVLVFFPSLYATGVDAAWRNGQEYSLWMSGVTTFSVVVITVHLQLIIVMDFWNWLHHLSIWASIAVWYLYLLVYGAFPPDFTVTENTWFLFVEIVAKVPRNWIVTLTVPVLAVLPEFVFRSVWRQLYPDDHHIIQEHLKFTEHQYASQKSNHHLARAITAALAADPGRSPPQGFTHPPEGAPSSTNPPGAPPHPGPASEAPPSGPTRPTGASQALGPAAQRATTPPDVLQRISTGIAHGAGPRMPSGGAPRPPRVPLDTPGFASGQGRGGGAHTRGHSRGAVMDWSSGVVGSVDLDVHHPVTDHLRRVEQQMPDRHKRAYSSEAVVLGNLLHAPVDDIVERERENEPARGHRRGARGMR